MDAYLGQITLFAGNYAPEGWALCNGQLMQVAQNQALYAVIGNTYGGSPGSTFALPNLQGRVPLHPGAVAGQPNHYIGQQGGAETVALSVNQMPGHVHSMTAPPGGASSANGTTTSPVGAYPAQILGDQGSPLLAYSQTANGTLAAGSVVTSNTGAAGGSQPISVMQPYLAVNFIICTSGLFPVRA